MAAAYPASIKAFLTYLNQPSTPATIVPDPDRPNQTPPATVDLTLIRGKVINEIHDEVMALEKTMGATGAKATVIPGTTTMGGEIRYLHNYKSSGKIDPANKVVYANTIPSHNHSHNEISALRADDHKQYMRVDGTRAFTAPVSAPNAANGHQLATLAQGQSAGLTSPQVASIIQSALTTSADHPMHGPGPGRYRMTGGFYTGQTDRNGNAFIDFSYARFSRLISFVYMKNPFPGLSMLGYYAYQYMEDQLILLSLSPQNATIQFIEDIVVDRQALIGMTWMALGV
jgi:hypothetical protein